MTAFVVSGTIYWDQRTEGETDLYLERKEKTKKITIFWDVFEVCMGHPAEAIQQVGYHGYDKGTRPGQSLKPWLYQINPGGKEE